jgi:hypothetical protein
MRKADPSWHFDTPLIKLGRLVTRCRNKFKLFRNQFVELCRDFWGGAIPIMCVRANSNAHFAAAARSSRLGVIWKLLDVPTQAAL